MRQITKNQNLLGSLRDSIPPICLSLGYNILLFKPSHYGFRSCTWADLRTKELGGVKVDEKRPKYCMKKPVASHVLTRATYTNISQNRFTWWEELMVIESAKGVQRTPLSPWPHAGAVV